MPFLGHNTGVLWGVQYGYGDVMKAIAAPLWLGIPRVSVSLDWHFWGCADNGMEGAATNEQEEKISLVFSTS
ncbi:hypothetical protein JTE90_020582 [Oedothorax gibbosus]|uniref:Uncharacterized protein n=1 Tax=Oedothorax gibbosus TaxID=931172 RepID=A0AAV6VYZ2_9ARAC|nr:hypothetical protein JTE90_020582 [Oedothorax gibbosus]